MTVTVTPTVEAAAIPPRVRLDVVGTTEVATTVLRLNPDGTRSPVRTTDGGPLPLPGVVTVTDYGDGTAASDVVTFNSDDTAVALIADYGDGTAPESVSGGGGLLYDYEAPFGQPVSYTTLESPDAVSVQVTVPATQLWLVHPGVPALSLPLDLLPGSLMEEDYAARQAPFYPSGRTTPVVFTDGARKAAASQVVTLTQDFNQLNALRALVQDLGVLLLNIPAQLNMGFDTCYVAVQDMKIERLTDVGASPNRAVTLPFLVVGRPAGGTQAERTWTDVLAAYATWADVQAAYPTWLDVLAGP